MSTVGGTQCRLLAGPIGPLALDFALVLKSESAKDAIDQADLILTIGYDIAVAGDDKELAENDEVICDMLFSLGLIEAAVDVLECDTTCNLMILDLKTQAEAQLVVKELARVNEVDLMTDIIPVKTSTEGSLLLRLNEKLLGKRGLDL